MQGLRCFDSCVEAGDGCVIAHSGMCGFRILCRLGFVVHFAVDIRGILKSSCKSHIVKLPYLHKAMSELGPLPHN